MRYIVIYKYIDDEKQLFKGKYVLELRPTCEHCNKELPTNSTEAMICTYECTFCKTCVESVLMNVCPNCTGGFVLRPVRPKLQLGRNPALDKAKHSPVDLEKQQKLILIYENINPAER